MPRFQQRHFDVNLGIDCTSVILNITSLPSRPRVPTIGISPVTTPPGPRTAPTAPAAPAAPPAPPPSPARAVPVVASKANPPETIGKLTERMEIIT